MSFELPEKTSLEELQATNPKHNEHSETWEIIDDLVAGGHRMAAKKRKYILRRPQEDAELYNLRLQKFVYTPILGDVLSKYTTKLTSAPVHTTGTDSKAWQEFKDATDGRSRNERDLLSELFDSMQRYGVVWAVVDRNFVPTGPVSRLEEERLGIKPRVSVLNPQDVLNWELDESTNQPLWVLYRSVRAVGGPLQQKKYVARWTIVDDVHMTVYSALVNIDKVTGNITGLASDPETDTYTPSEALVSMESQIAHGLPGIPIVYHSLSSELWSCDQAYLKSLQYLQVENAWTDTASVAGYIQRLYKPRKPEADTLGGLATMAGANPKRTSLASGVSKEIQKVESSNASILIGDDFKFVEARGDSLKTVAEDFLDRVEAQIKSLVYAGASSPAAQTPDVKEQSGIAKAFDMDELHDKMRMFGQVLIAIYEDILRIVAPMLYTNPEQVHVTGLDEFDVDVLGSLLDDTLKLERFESKLSPTALRTWYGKVAEAMSRTVSPEIKEQIKAEAEALDIEAIRAEEEQERQAERAAKVAKLAAAQANVSKLKQAPKPKNSTRNG